ncbi:hypothetical protein PLESTB_001145000 [Pleodorina starrii]|uniref:cellulase n=1 Tax=Pleodorina starrii TaxID=330485 RepID=A0A9W6BSN3_9CHLO|nr:hypothetical protein PLESTB_001145000 [Pleodorina starrii]
MLWRPPIGTTNPYPSSSYADDLAWAAAWLCRADVDGGGGSLSASSLASCSSAAALWDATKSANLDLTWDNVAAAAALLLRDTGAGGPTYVAAYDDFINRLLDRWTALRPCNSSAATPCTTAGGLAWSGVPGSTRSAANMAVVALAAAAAAARRNGSSAAVTDTAAAAATAATNIGGPLSEDAALVGLQCWAHSQLSYILGSNPQNQSFVVGYRPSPFHQSPLRPHHRSSSCSPDYTSGCSWTALDSPCPNPSVLAGALVGGPDGLDGYTDRRCDSQFRNRVALEYNAGFTGALAGLAELEQALQIAGCSWPGYCTRTCSSSSPSPPPANNSGFCGATDVACQQCDAPASSFASPAACRTCVSTLRALGADPWRCMACSGGNGGASTDAALQGVCLADCVPTTVANGTDWSCSQYCAHPSLVGSNVTKSRQCVECVRGASNPGDCFYCMMVSASQPDPDASRASCLDCLTSTSLGSWACGECAKMTTEPQRTECIHNPTMPAASPPPPPSQQQPSPYPYPTPSPSPTPGSSASAPPPSPLPPPAGPVNCSANDWACNQCSQPSFTAPSACRSCVVGLQQSGRNPWGCLACGYGPSSDASLQGLCQTE